MTQQEKTIAAIEKTMRKWIEGKLKTYADMPECQILTTAQGEQAIKANPAAQEIRAAFKDYCYVVKTMRELSGDKSEVEVDSIEELRKKFRIA